MSGKRIAKHRWQYDILSYIALKKIVCRNWKYFLANVLEMNQSTRRKYYEAFGNR